MHLKNLVACTRHMSQTIHFLWNPVVWAWVLAAVYVAQVQGFSLFAYFRTLVLGEDSSAILRANNHVRELVDHGESRCREGRLWPCSIIKSGAWEELPPRLLIVCLLVLHRRFCEGGAWCSLVSENT